MKTEKDVRKDFEHFLLEYTGRGIEYHERYKTCDLDFGWKCWKRATEIERERCAFLVNGNNGWRQDTNRYVDNLADAIRGAATIQRD